MKRAVRRTVRRFVTNPVKQAFSAPTPQVIRGVVAAPVLAGIAFGFAGVNAAAAHSPASVTAAPGPIAGARLYANPESQARRAASGARGRDAAVLARIADQPTAVWMGEWSGDVRSSVDRVISAAAREGSLPVLVAYNIPNRDCGSYSAGGAGNGDKYRAWIGGFARGINGRRAVVILEPDALAGMTCLKGAAQAERIALLRHAVDVLKQNGATVYIDAGHAGWLGASEVANRLKEVGIDRADGFALNVSNFLSTSQNASYGTKVSQLVGGKHFVIDTSRNGNGGNGEWCNPRGRALGELPTTRTGHALIDAYLWIKRPGESDGTCNGGPRAGQFWAEYAIELARNSQVLAMN